MAIQFDSSTKTFLLNTKNATHAFFVNKFGYLQTLHFGAKIGQNDDLIKLTTTIDRGFCVSLSNARVRGESLELIESEFPIYGNGDFRHSAILTEDASGNRLEELKYVSHELLAQKPKLDSMPSLDGDQALKIVLGSKNLLVELYYSVYENEDAFTRHVVVKNISKLSVNVLRLMSLNLDLPSANKYDAITLEGRHCSERNIQRTALSHGVFSINSNRGTSSHQLNPFLCLAEKNADENHGGVIGINYVYGGNFSISCEVDQFYSLRVQSGFNPFDFSALLEPNEQIESPETVLVYSGDGLGGMSRAFHDLYRNHLMDKKHATSVRPIVINSWEAMYFDFNTEKLFSLIDACKGLGIDTFVLDDGWFGYRNDDTTSLGDWFVNTEKLKGGLDPIIERCKQNGLKFGLWFEPEMISQDSLLYRKHPNWCIKVDGIAPSLGRDQLILDLSCSEVLDYLKTTIGDILRQHDISYVKWDMNRHMTDVCSSGLPSSRQKELRHRYMLGFYSLIEYFVNEFDDILFEGCSGGGGRYDASMLRYFPQYWSSDCTDAFERGKIQYGTSLCYPLCSTSNHISICPNHQTGRNTPLSTRSNIAMLGSFGYELNPLTFTKEEIEAVKRQTKIYKKIAPLIMRGDLYRLCDPNTSGAFSFLVVSKDKSQAHLTFMNGATESNAPKKRLLLHGLAPEKKYRIETLEPQNYDSTITNSVVKSDETLILSGQTLISHGFPLPQFLGDFLSVSYLLCEVK